MAYSRPCVLSIAGLDPSGGAGLLADIKTFEQQHCLGFGVASAITAQTEDHFFHIEWLPFDRICQQCEPLLDRYALEVIKIGIMESIATLLQVTSWLKSKQKNIRIVWDPVITSSSGFRFLSPADEAKLPDLLQQLCLVTPNISEAMQLGQNADAQQAAAGMARHCSVLLKGGHAAQEKGIDYLYDQQERIMLPPSRADLPAKHGSGCILSAAIAAQLAQGNTLEQACIRAKSYIEKTLNSNPHLLAYHYV